MVGVKNMVSAEREPTVGVWEHSPQWGPEQRSPGQGGFAPEADDIL
jgi:hypothetical protein